MNWITYEHDEVAASKLRQEVLGDEPITPIKGAAKAGSVCVRCSSVKTSGGFCLCS